jgi:hypothetical protein
MHAADAIRKGTLGIVEAPGMGDADAANDARKRYHPATMIGMAELRRRRRREGEQGQKNKDEATPEHYECVSQTR